MANLSSQSQLQESNPSLPNSQDPNSNHGIHIPRSPPSISGQSPGPLDATAQDAGGSSRELCEIDLSEILPAEALLPLMDEIGTRERQRKELAEQVSSLEYLFQAVFSS